MGKIKDLTNQRFGHLVALEPTQQRCGRAVVWKCRCDCGKETYQASHNLVSGRVTSCGCFRREKQKKAFGENIHFVDGTCPEKLAARSTQKNNTEGFRGIYKNKKTGKYIVQLAFQGKRYYLGSYEKLEEAIQARLEGEKIYDEFLQEYYAKTGEKGR